MVLVFLAIQDSLNHPSISRMPISPNVAISIVSSTFNMSENQIDKSPQYVYVKPDGNVYESDLEFNNIGKIIGNTEPPNTSGSHFAWEINNLQNKKKYYVDGISGEIISYSSYK